ncbi:MAG: large conductance mechanosensitive channel protein MscL [Candidatus Babeliales bacterium]|nr:large conductance mechanosensitive channel protein MscL [Candidatus Babeliales bacterium]
MSKINELMSEFKHFALKTSAVDMAVGIVLGVSFGKVVSSLVNDIVTPPIGFLLGGATFPNLKIILKEAVKHKNHIITPEVAISYGHFLQAVIDFLLISFSAFLIMKFINKLILHRETQDVDWAEKIKM